MVKVCVFLRFFVTEVACLKKESSYCPDGFFFSGCGKDNFNTVAGRKKTELLAALNALEVTKRGFRVIGEGQLLTHFYWGSFVVDTQDKNGINGHRNASPAVNR
jgi:hypothetical protein